MKLPLHLALTIEHNPHKVFYETVEQHLYEQDLSDDNVWIDPEDKKKCIETDNLWMIHWYPHTPIGYHIMYGSSLEQLLDHINNTLT